MTTRVTLKIWEPPLVFSSAGTFVDPAFLPAPRPFKIFMNEQSFFAESNPFIRQSKFRKIYSISKCRLFGQRGTAQDVLSVKEQQSFE